MTVLETTVPEDEVWHRLSPKMLLIHPVSQLLNALPQFIGLSVVGSFLGIDHWLLALFGLAAGMGISRWYTTRLRITPSTVELKVGLIVRKTQSARRDRIRTVDVTARPLHRLLGVRMVVVGTGNTDAGGAGRLTLNGLSRETAESLRSELLQRVQRDASESTNDIDGDELVRFDRSWIRYAPLTFSGLLGGSVLGTLAFQGEDVLGFDLQDGLHALSDSAQGVPLWAQITALVTTLLLCAVLVSVSSYVLSYWGFRLVRHDAGTLQVTRGLMTTRATTIDQQRLVGATVSEPLGLRLAGAATTSSIATGLNEGSSSGGGSKLLVPPAPHVLAVDVAQRVLGTTAPSTPLLRHPRNALRRQIVGAALEALWAVAISTVIVWFWAPMWVLYPAAAWLVLSPLIGVDRFRTLGHALTDGWLSSRTGSLERRRITLDTAAVIGWNTTSNLFQRRLGLITVTATTAAGSKAYHVPDVDPTEALRLMQTASPALVEPFVLG